MKRCYVIVAPYTGYWNILDWTKVVDWRLTFLNPGLYHLLRHLSLISCLCTSIPAEGHNMADSFGEALPGPDAPRRLSKHGAAVHKDAYCVPASVYVCI